MHPFCSHLTNQTKLRWLCEEVRQGSTREQRLRKQHQQTRDQLKALRQSRDSEQTALLQRLDQQEKLLNSLSNEKKGVLIKKCSCTLILFTLTKQVTVQRLILWFWTCGFLT